jgi:predicted RNase H-like nuclease
VAAGAARGLRPAVLVPGPQSPRGAGLGRGLVFGVDGCPGGWIAAAAASLEDEPRFRVFEDFAALVQAIEPPGSLAFVDIPIGLCDGRRACDGEARRLLGARACCVFTPPCRGALRGRSREEVRRLNVAASGGRSLSSQALGIVPKIAQVDALMTPALQARVRETHPECTFAALSPSGAALAHRKKSVAGRGARLALLPAPFARAAAAAPPYPRGVVAPDDYVDALAALTTALRYREGRAHRLPAKEGERDARGLAMEIWY